MIIAHNKNKERVLIRDANINEKYYCPLCNEELVQRKGSKRRWCFAHKPNRVCSEFRFADMCEWHIDWQNNFPKDNIEVIKFDGNGKKHIADVLIDNTEIEFQHSYMPFEEFDDRNNFYRKLDYQVIWVFDGNDVFDKGYNYGPFPFSKRFECLKQLKEIPDYLNIFIEGKTRLNLFTQEGLFLHHVSAIDEKKGIIFDKKCTKEQFLNGIKDKIEIEYGNEDEYQDLFDSEPIPESSAVNVNYSKKQTLLEIVNKYQYADIIIAENTLTGYEVLIDKYNANRLKQGKKAYGKIKKDYGKFKGSSTEIYYVNSPVWIFKTYY